jgi:hypothetical protein
MIFPFTISYTRRLSKKLSDNETARALNQIKTIVEKKTAEDVEIKNNSLTFKVSFLRPTWNWNIMVPIEKGQFNLVTTDSATTLTYEFFMYRMFIITSIMSTFGGLVSGQIGVGIFFLTVLLWLNWGIALIRHNGLLDDIEWEINEELKTGLVTGD